MAEVEIAGMTFKGGKMAIILTALSTLGGASWAGFEFYKDYMDMKEIADRNQCENFRRIATPDSHEGFINSLGEEVIRLYSKLQNFEYKKSKGL